MPILAALILAAMLAVFGGSATAATPASGLALALEVRGTIDPASRDFILRGLAQAQERNAIVAILKLDTPGGLDSSMRDIIQAILASPVPVIGYVAPDGARAASAGVYLLYACHLAAMAPATNLGAATPVQIGGLLLSSPPSREPASEPAASKPGEPSTTPLEAAPAPAGAMERKLINDARAYLRSLA
ncbi:MAG TPA: nodulation protein NfeD, partial [Candidatus Contendobacter sp.]|nr:nodulation protein NfeD [Candidatus Contendobacter sp.]